MKLILILPAGDGRRAEVKQEFDRDILVRLFQAAADECRDLSNRELALILANDNIALRPIKGFEETKPDLTLPINGRVIRK